MPKTIIRKPIKVIGNTLVFRDAEPDDAEFILKLRNDKKKSRFISKTSTDVNKQRQWLESYTKDANQIYFIIQNKGLEPVGTVRIYDQIGESFCWGSWILSKGSPLSHSIESALIVYHFAQYLGFTEAHFDVRRGNKSVWRFHEKFGAIRVKETDIDYYYKLPEENMAESLKKYKKFLPNGIKVVM